MIKRIHWWMLAVAIALASHGCTATTTTLVIKGHVDGDVNVQPKTDAKNDIKADGTLAKPAP